MPTPQEFLVRCKTPQDLKRWVHHNAADMMVKTEANMYIDLMASQITKKGETMVFEFSVREFRDPVSLAMTPGVNMVEFQRPNGQKLGWAFYLANDKLVKMVPSMGEGVTIAMPSLGAGENPVH